MPGVVRLVFPWEDGDKVPYWSAKNTHNRGELGVLVWCIAILENSTLEYISVQVPVGPGVIHQQSFHGFYTYFSPAIAVWEGH